METKSLALTKPIVLVGMMGSGKSSVGKKLAAALGLNFIDIDEEIEMVSERKISEIFSEFGEDEFRRLEARVIERVLGEGTQVVATGGGAFVNPTSREIILDQGVSIWLDASLDTLWSRVKDKSHRPLLRTPDPKGTLSALLQDRNPFYALANFRVESHANQTHEEMVERIRKVLGF